MEFNSLFGLGRGDKKLPPHHNLKELGDNLEVLANYFLDLEPRDALNNLAETSAGNASSVKI